MRYNIIGNANINDLVKGVQDYLDNGWQPIGGVAHIGELVCQAMILGDLQPSVSEPDEEGARPVFSEGKGTRMVQAKRRFALRVGIWDPKKGDWAMNDKGSLKKTLPPMGKRIYIEKKQVLEVWTPYVPIDGGRAWEPVQYPGSLVLESLVERV